MKRILSILAVVCLIVALAVPTLAAGNYTVSGVWVFHDNPDPNSFREIDSNASVVTVNVNFTSNGQSYNRIMATQNGATTTRGFAYNTSSSQNAAVFRLDTGWSKEAYKTINFGSTPQAVPVAFYNWLVENATPPTCDGSACSVADYDVNGICDTCGMTLAYSVQRNYTPNTYPSSLPVLPLGFNDSDDFVVVEVNGVTYLHALVNYGDLDHWDTKASSTSYRATAYGVNGEPVITKYYKYQLVDGDWSQVQSSLTQTTTTFGKFDEVTFIYSTIDIKDSDGNLFFPVPLWMEMDRVTQGEMVQTAETVVGTMTTLVLCGVGCLALLVVLKLFGKRSLISRN